MVIQSVLRCSVVSCGFSHIW